MPAVDAVSTSPTCARPDIVGAPVALLAAVTTTAVASLVSGPSGLSASSTKETFTLRVLPQSAATAV